MTRRWGQGAAMFSLGGLLLVWVSSEGFASAEVDKLLCWCSWYDLGCPRVQVLLDLV